MNNVSKQVAKTIKEHALIGCGDVVLLGLSGGPDSLCLLHVLGELQAELDFELRALHLNHKVRSDADSDAKWLQNHCGQMGVPLSIVTVDVPAIAAAGGLSVEEAGRKERQKALFEEAGRIAIEKEAAAAGSAERQDPRLIGAGSYSSKVENSWNGENLAPICSGIKIALAHNRDDQAETVLLRLLRGTGTHGLAAMEYKRADGLIRPLLDASRSDIEAYCSENNLQPRIDSTNASTDYTRNKVRLELIPELEAQFNPNIKETLCRLAANAREDDAALQAAAEQWLAANAQGGASPGAELSRQIGRSPAANMQGIASEPQIGRNPAACAGPQNAISPAAELSQQIGKSPAAGAGPQNAISSAAVGAGPAAELSRQIGRSSAANMQGIAPEPQIGRNPVAASDPQNAISPAATGAAQIALPLKALAALQPAVFKRVIVLAFSKIGLGQDIAAVHLNSLKQAVDKNYGGKVIEFPHNYKAKIEKGFAVLSR